MDRNLYQHQVRLQMDKARCDGMHKVNQRAQEAVDELKEVLTLNLTQEAVIKQQIMKALFAVKIPVSTFY